MKRNTKNKLLTCLLTIVIALLAAVFAVFSHTTTAQAYTNANIPTDDNVVENIFKANGKFNSDNLDLLAQKAGYKDITAMVTAAEGGEIKTSEDFGETVVNLGSYEYGGTKHELTWIPVYLSNSDEGPILTLWLAGTEGENGTVSDQEISRFTDGTMNNGKDTTPSCNNYSTSYIRTVTLNNGGTYYGDYGKDVASTATVTPTAYDYTATSDGSNKFEMLTTGALKQYIVTPSQVSWQKNANRLKNDPEWAGNSSGHYTQSGWLDDKLWLPSMYEVYDNTIPANSELDYITRKNKVSGLWNTSVKQRMNNDEVSWTRSGYYDHFDYTFAMDSNGADNDYYYSWAPCAVRPALHLNLSKAVENAESHTHDMTKTDAVAAGCTTPGNKAYWQCSICDKYFSDEVGITEIELDSTVIAATGHDYATAWTTDGTNHWHVCNNGCGIKDSDGEHTGGTATCQQKATCSVCGQTYGSLADHDLEHHAAKSPTCTEIGWNAYDTCKVSGCDYTTYVEIKENGHTSSDWIEDKAPTCTEEGAKHKECTVCHTTLETGTIETIPHTPGAAATCTADQICTKCGTVIIAATGHNYATAWTTDGTNHWHVCANGCGIKDSDGEHTGGTANCQQKATCSVCSQKYGELGDHDLEHHAAKSPTCTEIGWNAYDTCKVSGCNYTTYSEIDATGHAYSSEWTTDGSNHWHVCANGCDIKGSNAAHGFNWVIDKAATFTETGLKHEECTVCHLKRNENTEIPLVTCLHANTTHHDKVPATCVDKGTVEYKHCNDCNNNLDMSDMELTDLEIAVDPDNHVSFGAWGVAVPATCMAAGTEKRTCADCGHEETRALAIDPNAHDLLHHETQAATCTEIGWDAYDTCSRCDYTTYGVKAALGHNFGEWVTVKEATFTEDGSKRRECSRCDESETEVIPAKSVNENEITVQLAVNFVYGDEIAPVISVKYGEIVLKWYDTSTGEELAGKPVNAGSYKLVASVAENIEEGYTGVEKEVQFTIKKRELTVTIDAVSSEQGNELEALTSTITSGTVLNGDTPYTLTTNADKEAMGTYAITGICTNDNYNITFIDGVYIVSKKLEDPSGEIDLPVDINVEFKVTQSQTTSDYSELKGLKMGYWAQLWYRNDNGTLGDEFSDTINCILTLKIPTEIIEGIRGGEEINREKIAAGLNVYYVDSDGDYNKVKTFTIAQKEDESWIVKFNYNEKFRAEVVFNAPNVDEPVVEAESSGVPWWVWVLVVTGIAVSIILIVVIAIAVKNKKNGGNGGAPVVVRDNSDLKIRIAEQGEKIDELLGRDDGGFNTPVELDENGNVIFK